MKITRRDCCISILALIISGCSTQKASEVHDTSYARPDTHDLEVAIDLMTEDMDKYEMDQAMIDYTSYVSQNMHLMHSDDATQSDIDGVVKEIKRLRQIVIDEHNLPDAEDVSDVCFTDFVEMVPDNIGSNYHVFGCIRHTEGSFTTEYWKLLVQWNDSDVTGEACKVYIKGEYYKSKYKKYFDGNCTLEGFEERTGYPLFTCESDYTGR